MIFTKIGIRIFHNPHQRIATVNPGAWLLPNGFLDKLLDPKGGAIVNRTGQAAQLNFMGWGGTSSGGGTKVSNDPNDANAVPNHDDWGPDSFWDCPDWVTYHKTLVRAKGKDAADDIWVKAYDESSWASHETICATGNDAFKEYVQSEGLDKKSTILTKIYRAETALDKVGEPVRNIGKAISNTTSTLKWLVPTVLIVGVIGLGVYGYKTFIKT